jgi:hypothetical protein
MSILSLLFFSSLFTTSLSLASYLSISHVQHWSNPLSLIYLLALLCGAVLICSYVLIVLIFSLLSCLYLSQMNRNSWSVVFVGRSRLLSHFIQWLAIWLQKKVFSESFPSLRKQFSNEVWISLQIRGLFIRGTTRERRNLVKLQVLAIIWSNLNQ